MPHARRDLAAEDRALAKSLQANQLTVLRRSLSCLDALEKMQEMLDDLRCAELPGGATAKEVKRDATDQVSTDEASKLTKARKSLVRLKGYVQKLETVIDGTSVHPASDSVPESQSTAAHTPLTPVRPGSPVVSCPVDVLLNPSPTAQAGEKPPTTPPRIPAPSPSKSAPMWHDSLVETGSGEISIRGHRWSGGLKAPRRLEGPVFTRKPPDTPSPPNAVLKRDATACVWRVLKCDNQSHRVDREGVAYIAGLLVRYSAEDWEEMVRTWGMDILECHDSTGVWRWTVKGNERVF